MQQLLALLSDDPVLRLTQVAFLLLGVLAVFLLCFATRDILLRTRSFLYQAFCILLVALLPFVGFLLYLLVRPARTIKERENEEMLRQILAFTEDAEVVTEETETPEDEEESTGEGSEPASSDDSSTSSDS